MGNYKGDLQQKEITLQNAKSVNTIGVSYNVTGHISLRAEFSATNIEGNDQDNNNSALRKRNLNFKSFLSEGAVMLQYDAFDLENYKLTPYFFGGIGQFKFNPYTYDTVGRKVFLQWMGTEGQGLPQYPDRKMYKTTQYCIPFGIGVKYAISDYVHLGAEFATRKLFTDYLDDVSTTYVDENILLAGRGSTSVGLAYRGDELKSNPGTYPADGVKRGNPLLNDNYYFMQVRLGIRLPWFESGSTFGKEKLKRYSCPRF